MRREAGFIFRNRVSGKRVFMSSSLEDGRGALFGDPQPGRAIVIAQIGQSLDGRIATPTGQSRYINGACALDHLHRLRAQADAVLVGVGTVIADDPALTVRRVEGKNPARV